VFRWALIYGVPSLVMPILLLLFFLVYRKRSAVPDYISVLSMLCATIPAWAGVWALTHVMKMAMREPNDYTFERTCFTFAVLGAIAAVVWILRSRQVCSFGTLLSSVWMALVWGAIVFKF
jgi:hypothetical protein